MIRVIIKRRLKAGARESLYLLLRELRSAALHQAGHITGETLANIEDKSIFVVISTWSSLEDWKAWETSEARARLYKRIEPLLLEEPEVNIYQVMATEEKVT